jgi:hypothetical protein
MFFLNIEGFSNFSYYTEGKIVKKLRIPLYLILDGDVTSITKGRILEQIKKLSLPSSQVYTLKKNSIENYLMNPNVITRVLHSISGYR